ncbi:MAG: translation initiation factor [Bacteriovoracaceae bacterium]
MKDAKLVYSDDPKLSARCPKCKELMVECECQTEDVVVKNQIVAKIRMENNGRGGKTVSVIDNLPRNNQFLKDLCALLKKKCGTGGTFLIKNNVGVIEIQGEKRDTIKKILESEQIKFKG